MLWKNWTRILSVTYALCVAAYLEKHCVSCLLKVFSTTLEGSITSNTYSVPFSLDLVAASQLFLFSDIYEFYPPGFWRLCTELFMRLCFMALWRSLDHSVSWFKQSDLGSLELVSVCLGLTVKWRHVHCRLIQNVVCNAANIYDTMHICRTKNRITTHIKRPYAVMTWIDVRKLTTLAW